MEEWNSEGLVKGKEENCWRKLWSWRKQGRDKQTNEETRNYLEQWRIVVSKHDDIAAKNGQEESRKKLWMWIEYEEENQTRYEEEYWCQ